MRFGLLGPLEVTTDEGAAIELRGRKVRMLAAVLLCRANRPVSADTLVEALWGSVQREQARTGLRVYVHHLRQALGDSRIERRAEGYRLRVEPGELDVDRFRALVAQGQEAASSGDAAAAGDAFRGALALWRGPALAGLEDVHILDGEAQGLEELRLQAWERRFEVDLTLGRHAEIVEELRGVSARYPFREVVRGQLMRALAGSRRGAEAIAVFDETRRLLAAEFGMEPGSQLRELYLSILRDDPKLRPAPPSAPAPRQLPALVARLSGRARQLRSLDALLPPTAEDDQRPTATAEGGQGAGPNARGGQEPRPTAGGGRRPMPTAEDRQPKATAAANQRAHPGQSTAGQSTAGQSTAGQGTSPGRRTPPGQGTHAGQGPMPVAVVGGVAGIGKTALAVHWAHSVAERFPDGQLYLNLHGFDSTRAPVDPATALGLLLGALGMPARRIPVALAARENLYRSLLAGRRVLVLLDNAHDAAQVRPLLPGGSGCFVLVTSRNVLAGLVASGARPVALDLLAPGEARELLAGRLGAERTGAEPAAVDEIVARCGGLPLALSVVAARAAVMPGSPLATLAAELARSRRTLDGFASDDVTVDLRAVFSWSYRVLGAPAARMFRLLALHPGPDVTVPAAASLAGVPIDEARHALGELRAANLLGEATAGRYACHDLVRAYARELADSADSAAERAAAVHRLLDHYVQTAYPATLLIDPNQTPTAVGPVRPGVTPEPVADRREALDWFDRERAVILAAVALAADGAEPYAWQLAWSALIYLERSGHWQDKLAVLANALHAARRAGARAMEARTLRSIGRTQGRLHRYEEAYANLGAALELYRELGDVNGQAHATGSLAEILEHEGRHREALAMAEEAYELFHGVGNRIGEGRSLGSVGFLHALMGEYQQTISACRRALELFVAAGDRTGQAGVYDSLGVAYRHLGRHREAVASFRRALEALAETGERYYVAVVLDHLGDAHRAAGEMAAARQSWQRALATFTGLGAAEADDLRDKLREPDGRVAGTTVA